MFILISHYYTNLVFERYTQLSHLEEYSGFCVTKDLKLTGSQYFCSFSGRTFEIKDVINFIKTVVLLKRAIKVVYHSLENGYI